jgi:hypothetical protein
MEILVTAHKPPSRSMANASLLAQIQMVVMAELCASRRAGPINKLS